MSAIRGRNTQPELLVRRLLWARGKRYRIHDASVSGTPDISNKKRRVAVFIDGCFWHGCESCYTEQVFVTLIEIPILMDEPDLPWRKVSESSPCV